MPKPTPGQHNWGDQLNAFLDEKQDTATLDADVASKVTPGTALHDALSATYARLGSRAKHAPAFNLYFPEAEGAVADAGVTDSTAAIQATFNAAPAGATVVLAPTGVTNYYTTTASIVITKNNQRLLGPGRDGYASRIRCTTAGVTMFTIKASGFVMQDVALWGDVTTTNGVGATVTGLDLFGTSDGDVDARVDGATFQGLARAINVRGRNVSVLPDTLISNCLDGIVFDGKDATFHTGPNADQNRGNNVRGARFHNIGGAASNAAIKFTTTAKVLHAIVSDCHFDSNGLGRHVVAEGTSANPHKKITCFDNKHTELGASAYDFTYVNDSCIANAQLGGNTPAVAYDAIVLNNCDTVIVSDTYGVQIGRTGLYARNCVRLRLRDMVWRALGQHSGSTGHGFDIDSTNAGCDFDNLVIDTADGYGFTGSPPNSRMGSFEFTACTAGRFDSTVFGPPVIIVPAQDMTPITGTPNLAGVPGFGYPESYQFDQTTAEQVTMQVPDIPDDWRTFDLVLWWAPTNTAAGAVVWQTTYGWLTAGAVPNADSVSAGNDTGTAPGVTGQIVETVVATGIARKNTAMMIRVVRAAADAGDTYAGDAALIAVRLVRAS